ncbi:hypothetical protein HNQ36_001495 [Afipia massiliensis]|uniref:MerR family transcriptional regulator n=1 Tax=Afipia massiliensis TaxID=211460 RepID=A0A840N102_9BRAD|nr:hypothetical protein [Afipia massiliensis]MBB5051541.1 hypothetical protein [Afipia massiliensis]
MSNQEFELRASASELSELVGARSKDIDNWLQRPELLTRFKSTRTGARRSVSRLNVIELAFLAAFVRTGIKASTAVKLASDFAVRANRKELSDWLVFEPGEDPSGAGTLDHLPSTETLTLRTATARPPIVVLINVGEMVRRIDEVFSTRLIRRELKLTRD